MRKKNTRKRQTETKKKNICHRGRQWEGNRETEYIGGGNCALVEEMGVGHQMTDINYEQLCNGASHSDFILKKKAIH